MAAWPPLGVALRLGLISVFFGWAFFVFLEARFFVVSLVTGVWFFETRSLAAQEGAVGTSSADAPQRAPVMTGIKLAFTKSFGTICLAGLIMWALEVVKKMERAARHHAERSDNAMVKLATCCILCFVECIRQYLEFVTKFSLVLHALSGEPFCDSARKLHQDFGRHGFRSWNVDWLASLVLTFGAFMLALLSAASVTFLAVVHADLPSTAQGDEDKARLAAAVGLVSWCVSAFLLTFVARILLNIVDAAYCCVVLDLDHARAIGAYRHPQLAEVIIVKVHPTYVLVPGTAQPMGHPGMVAAPRVEVAQPMQQPTYMAVAQPMAPQYPQPVAMPVAQPMHPVAHPISPGVAVAQPVGYPPQPYPPQAVYAPQQPAVPMGRPV